MRAEKSQTNPLLILRQWLHDVLLSEWPKWQTSQSYTPSRHSSPMDNRSYFPREKRVFMIPETGGGSNVSEPRNHRAPYISLLKSQLANFDQHLLEHCLTYKTQSQQDKHRSRPCGSQVTGLELCFLDRNQSEWSYGELVSSLQQSRIGLGAHATSLYSSSSKVVGWQTNLNRIIECHSFCRQTLSGAKGHIPY